jgi:PAS domain S-box-containing protein
VALLDRQTEVIDFAYGFGDEFPPLKLGEGLTSRVINSREPLLINENRDWRHAEMGVESIGVPARSYLGVPIPVGRQVIGVISVQSTQREGRFDEDDVRLLSTIAANVGAAIQNAQLYEESQRRAGEMAALAEVGRDVASTLDPATVLERIAGHARELLAAGSSGVYLLQPDGRTLRVIAAVGDVADVLLGYEIEVGTGIVGHIVQSGVAGRIEDTTEDPRTVHILGTDETQEGEKLMVAPLLVQERAMGALAVWRDPRDQVFSQDDLNFLVGLAQQAAIAIENARLFAEVEGQKQFSESLVQNSPVAIVTADRAGRVSSWNPAAERLFGFSQAEALGHDLDELVATAEMRQEAAAFTGQTIRGSSVHAVTQRCRKDGTLVDVELLSVPVSIEGQDVGFIAIYHDISELKQAARAMEESERRLADIISFLPDATLVIDRQGKIIAWNRAIEEMTGVQAEDMLGQGDHEYALPFYGERRPILIDLVLQPDEEFEQKYEYITRQDAVLMGETYVPHLRGQGAYLYATASALRDAKGKIVGAIETIRDISARRQAEEDLQEAKEIAEAATQAKSAFLATMSHEIRTPMNAVIGMTSLLLDTDLSPEQQEFAETIRTSGDALLTVINDILDFSKIEAGRIDLERQPFDLRECVEGRRVWSWAVSSARRYRRPSPATRPACDRSCSTC